jgi:hypothetical protein
MIEHIEGGDAPEGIAAKREPPGVPSDAGIGNRSKHGRRIIKAHNRQAARPKGLDETALAAAYIQHRLQPLGGQPLGHFPMNVGSKPVLLNRFYVCPEAPRISIIVGRNSI